MSGRQAHGRPLLEKPGSRKKNNQRGGGASRPGRPVRAKNGRIDVLALAEKQVGETKSKGVRLRDLDIERDPSKRRRGSEEGEEGEEEDADDAGRVGGASKRRRRNDDEGAGDDDQADNSDNEMQSDSDGNEWHVGVGSDDDDSEIDSDEAFGESDDEMFDGYAFGGSSSASKNKKKQKRSGGKDDFEGFDEEEEEEEDEGDDGDSLGEDAIDLAQALDQVSSDEEEEGDATSMKKKKKKKKKSVSHADDSDDGSSAEDSGSLNSEGDDDDDDDDDDEDEDESESAVSSDDEDEDDDSDASDDFRLEELESMASAFAGKSKGDEAAAGAAGAGQDKVSLDDLGLFGVKDAQIKKSLKMLAKEEKGEAGSSKKLDVPLARIHQDRMSREAAAGKSHETLDRWVDTVKHNRRAEHLSFPVSGALEGTGLDSLELRPIVPKSAKTELEKTILSIMEESGLGASHRPEKKKGGDEKETLSPEELKQLVSQRRHQREVQSREQARARRIKKIKSKAYRRIHRRDKAKSEAAMAELEEGPDVDSEEEREAQHRRRAMERMGSRHRESKWAKRAKNTGRAAWDDDFRSGLVDMARRDEELRRRVAGRGSGDEDDSDGSSDEDEDEDEDDEAFRKRALRQVEEAGEEADKEPQSALMNIAFMQKAELARKKANDEAMAEMMRDLDADNSGDEADGGVDDDDDDDGRDSTWTTVGRRTYGAAKAGQTSGRAAKVRSAVRVVEEETERMEKTGTEKTETEKTEKTEKTGKTGRTEKTEKSAVASWGANGGSFREDTTAQKGLVPGEANAWSKSREPTTGGRRAKKEATARRSEAEGILLMDQAITDVVKSMSKTKEATTGKTRTTAAAAAAAAAGRARTAVDDSDTSSSGSSSSDDDDSDADRQDGAVVRGHGSLNVRDTDLLIRALGDDGAAAEFAREKTRVAAEEAEAAEAEADGGRRRGADFLPGWGSWSGEGISRRAAKRDQKRLPPGPADDGKTAARRRDAKLERVIISERRVQKNAKYLASQLPHEFETKNQYERSLRLPVGPEWGTKTAFQDSIKPRLLVKQGVVLPMARPLV